MRNGVGSNALRSLHTGTTFAQLVNARYTLPDEKYTQLQFIRLELCKRHFNTFKSVLFQIEALRMPYCITLHDCGPFLRDCKLVVEQTEVELKVAIKLLLQEDGDVINCIMEIQFM